MKQYVIVDLNEKIIARSNKLTFIDSEEKKGVSCYGTEGMARNAIRSKIFNWREVDSYMDENYGEDWYKENYGENLLKPKEVEICLENNG